MFHPIVTTSVIHQFSNCCEDVLAMMNVGIASSASDFIDELSPIFPSEPIYVLHMSVNVYAWLCLAIGMFHDPERGTDIP